MSSPRPIEDLSADELQAILSADGSRLSAAQAKALRAFIRRLGGLENARLAVAMLARLENAA